MASFPGSRKGGSLAEELECPLVFREMEDGSGQVGDRPHNRLMFFSDRGSMIYLRLQKEVATSSTGDEDREVCGIKPGLTRQFKLSTWLALGVEVS